MSPDDLERLVASLLDQFLHLEDGEMMMPLKHHEIFNLHNEIVALVNRAVREVTT